MRKISMMITPFCTKNDFIVSRPLHETANRTNVPQVNSLFNSQIANGDKDKLNMADLELMGAVFPTPYNNDNSDKRLLRDFECLPSATTNDGNYPQLPSGDPKKTFARLFVLNFTRWNV